MMRKTSQTKELPVVTQRLPRLALVFTLALTLAVSLLGAEGDVPLGNPEELGLSTERLTRIDDVVERAIAEETISGAVTLVARRGKIAHFEAHGVMDIESDAPMQTDTIFPIASMTKPVTGVAVLMLVEQLQQVMVIQY